MFTTYQYIHLWTLLHWLTVANTSILLLGDYYINYCIYTNVNIDILHKSWQGHFYTKCRTRHVLHNLFPPLKTLFFISQATTIAVLEQCTHVKALKAKDKQWVFIFSNMIYKFNLIQLLCCVNLFQSDINGTAARRVHLSTAYPAEQKSISLKWLH